MKAAGEAAEARRLLYVALTRAKEALVLCMRGKPRRTTRRGCRRAAGAMWSRRLRARAAASSRA